MYVGRTISTTGGPLLGSSAMDGRSLKRVMGRTLSPAYPSFFCVDLESAGWLVDTSQMRRNRLRFERNLEAAGFWKEARKLVLYLYVQVQLIIHNSTPEVKPRVLATMVTGSYARDVGAPSECSLNLAAALQELRKTEDLQW